MAMKSRDEESPRMRLFLDTLVIVGLALPWLLARLFRWVRDGQKWP